MIDIMEQVTQRYVHYLVNEQIYHGISIVCECEGLWVTIINKINNTTNFS